MEDRSSKDIFSDLDSSINSPVNNFADNSAASMSTTADEPEPESSLPQWKGVPMDEILKGFGPFDFEHLSPICPSANHTVLYMLPLPRQGPPKPYPSHPVNKWHPDFVRLPHSPQSRYPYQQEDGTTSQRRRWEVIQESLLRNLYTSRHLENAIASYNVKYARRWDFKALHHLFSTEYEEDEAQIFFQVLLPKIVQLALQLPEFVTGAIPLLKKHTNVTISLSQLQVASLLANAFLCTFPRRNSGNPNSEFSNYPYINFNGLFSTMKDERQNRSQAVMEKLKCLIHYFRRVTTKAPEGTITIQRKYVPKENCPKWDRCENPLPALHISSKGTIETEGAGLLQVDFANKFLGGGVLNWGCVQEEIRFVICPELLVTMLVTEALDDTEALIVCGVEQFSTYQGYSDDFKWNGNFVDETPRDSSGRRKTCIVAIDALYFSQKSCQFEVDNLTRELNKAYVGFVNHEIPRESLCPVATGNWGCGAFRGNPKLKVLVQLMAAAVAKRNVVYFTFGDTELCDSVSEMYWYLVGENIDTARLFSLLLQYQKSSPTSHSDFYLFLYKKSKMKIEPKNLSKKVSPKKEKKLEVPGKPKLCVERIPVCKRDERKNGFIPETKQKEYDQEKKIAKWLEESDEEEENEILPQEKGGEIKKISSENVEQEKILPNEEMDVKTDNSPNKKEKQLKSTKTDSSKARMVSNQKKISDFFSPAK